jgi:serine/threonine protein kinase
MKGLKCENVVSLRGVLRSPQNIWIVMECLAGGSLLDMLIISGRLDEKQARHYFRQIINGVQFCHEKNIYHRDLKPDNILLTADMLTAKVADFGLATLVEEGPTGRRKSMCGSAQYAAPEIFSGDLMPYLPGPSDIWGCGILLYIMVAGFPPFQDTVHVQLMEKICAARVRFPSWFSSELRDLIKTICKANPSERPSFEQIKNHPWYTDDEASSKPIPASNHRLNSPASLRASSLSRSPLAGSPPPPFSLEDASNATSSSSPVTKDSVLLTKSRSPPGSPESGAKRLLSASGASSSSKLSLSGITVLSDPEVDDYDEDDLETVPIANAFTLINMTGAFDLSRVFDGPAIKPFTLAHCTKFVWQGTSITNIFYKLVDIMSAHTLALKKNEQSGRISATGRTQQHSEPCSFHVQLYTMLPEASLVEFTFVKGSNQAFYELFASISAQAKSAYSLPRNDSF